MPKENSSQVGGYSKNSLVYLEHVGEYLFKTLTSLLNFLVEWSYLDIIIPLPSSLPDKFYCIICLHFCLKSLTCTLFLLMFPLIHISGFILVVLSVKVYFFLVTSVKYPGIQIIFNTCLLVSVHRITGYICS